MADRAPIRHAVLRKLLVELAHPNSEFVEYVCEGLRDGFDIGVEENEDGFHLPNLKTVRDWEGHVDKWLASEKLAGRLLGPFTTATLPHPRAQISPLGTAHKRSYDPDVVKRRVIYRLSAGPDRDHARSVNGSTLADPSLQYDTVGDAASVLRRFGTGAYMAKTDAEAAFRQVPVAPSAYHRMGVEWKEEMYLDTRVPFGLRMAPFIYTSVSDAVRFVVQTRINLALGEDQVVVLTLIGDFLVIGRDQQRCAVAHDILLSTFRQLNLPFVMEKTEGPRQAIEFLGIWFSRPTGGGLARRPAPRQVDRPRTPPRQDGEGARQGEEGPVAEHSGKAWLCTLGYAVVSPARVRDVPVGPLGQGWVQTRALGADDSSTPRRLRGVVGQVSRCTPHTTD